MEAETLCNHLMLWLGTFPGLEGRHSSPADLSDGVAMAEVLTQIAPEWFDLDWMSKIKRDVSDNYRLKLSNLKKVLKGVLDYYSEVLNQDLSGFNYPDVSDVAENASPIELARMLQLILGCAVNCEEKEQYIQAIMALEESVQHTVMNAIQELMVTSTRDLSRSSDTEAFYKDYDLQHKQTIEQLSTLLAEKEEMAQKLHDLEDQVNLLKEEKSTLLLENEHIRTRKSISDGDDREDGANKRVEQLVNQIDKLKDENFALENAKEDYRIRSEQQEKEIRSLQEKTEQLSSLAEEARALKDEMDILRHTQDKVTRYEATIEAYKKKLEELGDLRKQMKTLEDKNSLYMEQTLSLEESLKKANSYKTQLDMYKKQVHELQSKCLELEKKYDKAEFEATRAKEKQQMLEAENRRLRLEKETLKETNEELSLHHAAPESRLAADVHLHSPPSPLSDDFLALNDIVSPEVKEKFIRLQHENKMLKLQNEGAENEQIHLLQSVLDDAKERVNDLESENRQLNQKIMTLESDLTDAQEQRVADTQKTSQEETELKKKFQEHLEQLREASVELQRKKATIDELQSRSTTNSEEISNLREKLTKKEEEMRAMEDKYKKYLEKAKTVIKTLDPRKGQDSSPEIQHLRSMLQDKEKLIETLERDHERARLTREREEKLVVSAWYELSLQLHRKAAEERLSSGTGLSFLAKQRQAAATRRSLSGKSAPSTPSS